MKPDQNLHELTSGILLATKIVFEDFNPDYVLVHGDTTTSFATSLSAFYNKIKVAHIEAGLRTYDKWAPFPEEINRSINGRLADIHFAPTISSKDNLLRESISENKVIVTGNTVIDALFMSLNLVDYDKMKGLESIIENKKVILFTGHRRENFNGGFEEVFKALSYITERRDDTIIIYPVHPNPNVKLLAQKYFKSSNRIFLIDPLDYGEFVWLMEKSYLIITDSGGIQEEAPSLGKPILVIRETTERPEAVESGAVVLVGTDYSKITENTIKLLDNKDFYFEMASVQNPYGDGKASDRIISYFINKKYE
jgi:UDP-N-acetylglucosamine 2-epimerase (non-hydrolysing)